MTNFQIPLSDLYRDIAGQRPILMFAPPSQPNWEKWAYMPTAKLYEAVAVSLGIEPDTLPGMLTTEDPAILVLERSYAARIDVVLSHMAKDKIPGIIPHPNPLHSEVSLPDFGWWARSIGWEVPDQIPRTVANTQPTHRDEGAARAGNPRGPAPIKTNKVAEAMRDEIRNGTTTVSTLKSMKEVAMAAQYEASRETCRKARKLVLSEIVGGNSDK